MIPGAKVYTLITGASQGLGKAMAIECAARSFNLVLVSLPSGELYQLGSFLRRKFDINVCEFELDLTLRDDCILLWRSLREQGIQINMLVNNAGVGGTSEFRKTGMSVWERQIELNVLATVRLTHLFLPVLVARPRSYVLNVSSLAAFFSVPQKQTYGATKAFIYSFSKSLRKELKDEDVTVTVLCPGGIKSNPTLFFLNEHGSWLARRSSMTPEDVAKIAIDGLLAGKERIIPGRVNRILFYLDKVVPRTFKDALIRNQLKKMNGQKVEAHLGGTAADHRDAGYEILQTKIVL